LLDTAGDDLGATPFDGGNHYELHDRSLALFRTVAKDAGPPSVATLQSEILRKADDRTPRPMHQTAH
jgi:hypothetical protein